MTFAAIFVLVCQTYLTFGLMVALAFFLFGLERVEEGARGSFAFRPLLVPGLCMLWPLVIWRWGALVREGKHAK